MIYKVIIWRNTIWTWSKWLWLKMYSWINELGEIDCRINRWRLKPENVLLLNGLVWFSFAFDLLRRNTNPDEVEHNWTIYWTMLNHVEPGAGLWRAICVSRESSTFQWRLAFHSSRWLRACLGAREIESIVAWYSGVAQGEFCSINHRTRGAGAGTQGEVSFDVSHSWWEDFPVSCSVSYLSL